MLVLRLVFFITDRQKHAEKQLDDSRTLGKSVDRESKSNEPPLKRRKVDFSGSISGGEKPQGSSCPPSSNDLRQERSDVEEDAGELEDVDNGEKSSRCNSMKDDDRMSEPSFTLGGE